MLAVAFLLAGTILSVYGSPCPPELCGSSSVSKGCYIPDDVCEAIGYKIRKYIPNYYLEELQRKYFEIECKLFAKWAQYPLDIGGDLNSLTPEKLVYDVIVLELSEGTIASLIPLLEAGKQILILSEGGYLPFEASSVYDRVSMFDSSNYVRKYPVDCGNGITKYIYSGLTIGGLSVLDENDFFLPPKCAIDDWSPISDLWSWDKMQNVYSNYGYDYERKETKKTKKTSVHHTPFGMSICVEEIETTECSKIKNAYGELGYQTGIYSPSSGGAGFYQMPSFRRKNRNVLLIEEYLKYIAEKYCGRVDLSLYTKIKKLIFEHHRVVKILVETLNGQVIEICVRDYVLFGTYPLETARLLFNSGVGESSLLSKYGIDQVISAPYLGKHLSLSPVFHGISLKAPCGSLLPDDEDYDTSSLSYLIAGESTLSKVAGINYYKLLLQSTTSSFVNIKVNTYVFSRHTIRRLRYCLKYIFQFSEELIAYYLKIVLEYDIVFFGIQLLNDKSSAYIDFQGDIPTPYVKYNMCDHPEDIEDILYAVNELKRLLSTSAFNGFEAISWPFSNGGDIFSPDCIKNYLNEFTAPSLYVSGGTIMGNSIEDSMVDQYCRVHGIPNAVIFNSGIIPINYNFGSIGSSLIIGNYIADLLMSNYDKNTYDTYYPSCSADSLSLSDMNEIDINGVSGIGGIGGIGGINGNMYESSSSSSSSYDENKSQTIINNGGGLYGGSGFISHSSESESEKSMSQNSVQSVVGSGGQYSSYSEQSQSENSESEKFESVSYGQGGLSSIGLPLERGSHSHGCSSECMR